MSTPASPDGTAPANVREQPLEAQRGAAVAPEGRDELMRVGLRFHAQPEHEPAEDDVAAEHALVT